jgi:hypothetical protein
MNTDLSRLNLSFVHIGKTGGTTINHLLRKNKIKFKQYHMQKRYNNNEKYIIWLRNPISRFVSTYNFLYCSLQWDYKKNNIKDIKDINIDNCPVPIIIKGKILNKKKYLFNERFDHLLNYFKTPNNLAESLTSDNIEIKNKAIELLSVSNTFNSFLCGIGWYLNNGNFVKNRNDRILFVGKQETMKEDIERLGKLLNVELNSNKKVRENVYITEESKYLSPLAIKNIIDWYKDTDYKALEELHNHGWITKETLDSYYKY